MLDLSKKYLNLDLEKFTLEDTKKLQDLIKYHSDLYYNKQEPIISDFEYDNLFKKLTSLEFKFNLEEKQTFLVWAELLESSFNKVQHSRPMISLDNTYNEEDLRNFDERVFKNIWYSVSDLEYIMEYKFDWLWLELIYKNWKFIQAITRWNGIEWEDVTINAMQIENIPKNIAYKKHLEVRGEVVMPISVFNNLNDKAKIDWNKVFSNPRNAASWSLRMKDASVTKKRWLQFFAYDLANFDEFIKEEKIEKYFEVIKDLEKLGFDISSYFTKFWNIWEVVDEIRNNNNIKSGIDFDVDGLVLKVNNINLWSDIGWTEHHPRYAISYKFPAEILTTKILSVEHSVWRTWTITPVANLEPINIGWVIVKRATLHNYEEVENLDVRIWDNVFIKRAWEVIPKIISVIKEWNRDNYENILAPEFCPSCETRVKKDEDKVRYYCPNDIDCPAKNHEKLTFAVGKQGFNIDWFWEKQVELFLELGIIHNLVDIFNISKKREEILDLEGFREKSVTNLINWIEKAKNVDIVTLLTAIWISWVGKKTAKTISKLFESEFDLLNFNKSEETLEQLEDIWPEIAKNIINYFSNEAHRRLLWDLVKVLNITYYKKKVLNTESIFTWKKVCITGSFISEEGKKVSRDDLVKKLEDAGWSFVSSVSKNTDFVLAWEKAWSKLKKANDLWVKIIDLTYFLNNVKL